MTTLSPTATVALQGVMSRKFVLISSRWSSAQALAFLRGVRSSHVVVLRVEDNGERYVYLHLRRELVARLKAARPQATVHEVLDLHEYRATEQAEQGSDADAAPEVAVVTDGDSIVGFVDARVAPDTALRERSVIEVATGAADAVRAERPFRAYPALTAPDEVAVGQPFDLFVGFRSTPDLALGDAKAIEVPTPDPAKQCLVLLSGDGVTLDREHDLVPLRENAVVHFTGTLKVGATVGSVKVHYVYDQQVIGGARREIRAVEARLPEPLLARPNPCRMALPDAAAAVDLTVSLSHQSDGTLEWRFIAPACPRHDTTLKLKTKLPGTSEFAATLMHDLGALKFRGPLARNVLDTIGRDVAALIPSPFFNILSDVHDALGRLPTLLWLTDEAYVPWELATLDRPLDATAPPFLAAQTLMGRWLDDERVMLPPPLSVDVKRVSVVASEYGIASGQRKLTEAIAERETLCKRWDGLPFEATNTDLTTLAGGIKLPGHLLHFAVHGFSDPAANVQSLVLADKTELPAKALIGAHRCGELPRFSFVFLNACQVGTPGRSLGQAGGFPGELLRGGANGFVAPLWDVDDAAARSLAESFYDDVFSNGHSVGAALHARRRDYIGDSTTPVAYLYYGHPGLSLRRGA
jgi:Ternary complex associated domain 7/CHAT domain